MDIKHGENRFYVEDDQGTVVAELSYQFEDERTMLANSTFVDPSLRGRGMAGKLVDALADYARRKDYKIRPLCSYVVKRFEDRDDYEDVKA